MLAGDILKFTHYKTPFLFVTFATVQGNAIQFFKYSHYINKLRYKLSLFSLLRIKKPFNLMKGLI